MTTAFSKRTQAVQEQLIDHLIEGNGTVDLAHQLLERMDDKELDAMIAADAEATAALKG